MGSVAKHGSVEPVLLNGRLPAAEVSSHIDKILLSESFKNSEFLRGLLIYLGRLYADKPDGSVSEHDLAVSVFGRRSDFDSRTDSVVRVHTGRLRSRLAEYYMSEGNSDDVLIEIPKGRYCLIARHRPTSQAHDLGDPGLPPEMRPVPDPSKGGRRWYGPATVVIAGLALIVIGVGLGRFLQFEPLPPALSTLWMEFVHQSTPTLVIFSNPPFVGSPYGGLHLFRPGVDSVSEINDFYSGPGEVVAAHHLTATFLTLRSSILVKRAQSLSWDEAQGRGLVIIGSPAQNLPAKEIPIDGFHFTHGEKSNEIVNEKPGQGEPAAYRTYGPPYTTDYAIVAYGESPNHAFPAMVLAGTTTYGTQAAAEFVTNEKRVSELLSMLQVRHHQTVPHFTVILEQKMIGGAIVQSRPVLVRIQGGNPRSAAKRKADQ